MQDVCYATNKVISPGRVTHIRDMQNARCFTGLFPNTRFPAVALSFPDYLLPLYYI